MKSKEGGTTREKCWKRIGVWGTQRPRCSELDKIIHCHNCDIFNEVGSSLLERDLPRDYQDEWRDVLAVEKGEEVLETQSVIIFRVAGEWLALRSEVFSEIIDPTCPHSVPHRINPVFMGLVNVHGEIRICVSLKELLNIETGSLPTERWVYKRMIVMNREGSQWVFPVDEIHGVYRAHRDDFQNVPVAVARGQSTFTKGIFGWRDKHVALLDDELLVYRLTRSVQ